jgi:CHRD domain-containing protein
LLELSLSKGGFMRTRVLTRLVPGLFGLCAAASFPVAADVLNADLSGFNEVPTLSSPASADFHARINKDETEIQYELTYSGFATPVLQSHLHLGKRAVNGGIMVFLCSNLGNGPAGTPACPTPAGTVTGTLTAAGVVGPAAQGITAGEFAEVVKAIRNGAAYANVHSQAFPGGEVRDQVRDFRSHRDGDRD